MLNFLLFIKIFLGTLMLSSSEKLDSAEVFCQISCYLVQLFRQIICYFAELLCLIAFPINIITLSNSDIEKIFVTSGWFMLPLLGVSDDCTQRVSQNIAQNHGIRINSNQNMKWNYEKRRQGFVVSDKD